MGTGIKKERRRLAADIDEKCDRLAKALLTNSLVQALGINHACTEFLDWKECEVWGQVKTE